MLLQLGGWPKSLARVAALFLLSAGAGACSSIPDWVDPTTWIGGGSDTASDQSADTSADANADTGNTASADNSQTPDVAGIPDKPAPPSTSDEQKQVADSLEADRSHAHYSADALRGGTEPAVAPPSAAPPSTQSGPEASAATSSSDQSASGTSADTGADQTASADNSSPQGPAAADQTAAATGNQTAPSADSSPAADTAAAPSARAPGKEVAMAEAATPAASARTTLPPVLPPAASDSSLGFQPSKAPPLDPSVAQFVPAPVIARYRQTASSASTGRIGATGSSVFTNPDVLQNASYAGPSYSATQAMAPSAVILFPHDTMVLDAAARAQVRIAADAYRAQGGQGYARIVGHSSSRAAGMPLARQLQFDFERSQSRATAVARELIHDGVPASKVLVEAVGDTQQGDRGAEIFLQS